MSDKDEAAQQDSGVNEQVVIQDKSEEPQTEADKEQEQAVTDYSEDTKGQLSMEVKVYSPFHDYYDGPAFSVSAENTTGPFDVLPKHHNFICLLMPCDVVLRTPEHGNQKIRISGGIMHVKADKVVIFLDV